MKSVKYVRVPSEEVSKTSDAHERFIKGIQTLMEEHYQECLRERRRGRTFNYQRFENGKAVGYVRVSSHGQRHGHSIEAQKKLLQEFAKRKGYEIAKFFEDFGTANSNRKGYNEMMTYLNKNHKIKCVLCTDVSRLHHSFQCPNL